MDALTALSLAEGDVGDGRVELLGADRTFTGGVWRFATFLQTPLEVRGCGAKKIFVDGELAVDVLGLDLNDSAEPVLCQ